MESQPKITYFFFWILQIDKEIKRLRLEEEKRLQDLKDQEKRNERARKLEEIQNLLEKQSKEAEEVT